MDTELKFNTKECQYLYTNLLTEEVKDMEIFRGGSQCVLECMNLCDKICDHFDNLLLRFNGDESMAMRATLTLAKEKTIASFLHEMYTPRKKKQSR